MPFATFFIATVFLASFLLRALELITVSSGLPPTVKFLPRHKAKGGGITFSYDVIKNNKILCIHRHFGCRHVSLYFPAPL